MNQRILCTTLTMGVAFSTTVLAQEDVVAPFWCAVDSVSMSLGNTAKDLYTDLSLLDTIKIAGETFPITWKSSDTLFLTHDGHINGRFVQHDTRTEHTLPIHDECTTTSIAVER